MEASVAENRATWRFEWMFDRKFDICFFFAPVLFALALFQLAHATQLAASAFWSIVFVNAFGAGFFHQGATLFTYLDKKNRDYYSGTKKRFAFYLAPIVIMILSVAGMFLCPVLIKAIWMAWSLQHLVQQNVGILLLYHHHKQGEAIVPRPIEQRSQHAAALFFGVIFFHRVMLANPPGWFFDLVNGLALLWALYACGTYVLELRRQILSGLYLNVPMLLFWMISILILSPIAFLGKTFEEAYVIPVTIHWFQYIGLNLWLVKKKYATDELNNLPLDKPILLFVFFCFAIVFLGISLSFYQDQIANLQWQKVLFAGILLGAGNVHYFLDAYIWRFREEFPRQTILPYLKTR